MRNPIIEASFNHKEQVPLEELSIEHIMPQKLNDWWREHLGEDGAITHQLFIHCLANLTLTAYNSELSNDDFLAKRNRFENSHLELNSYFNKQESWRREDIEARGKQLADIALQIWSYFGDELALPSQPSSLTGSIPKSVRIVEKIYPVKSWRDVLEFTLNEIDDLNPNKFKDIMEQFPRFISLDEKEFRSARKLKNGAFIEVNLSAKNIYAFCLKALEIAELSQDEWYVEKVSK